MKAIFLVFIFLAVTSVHSRRIKKKAKNDESNEKLINDDDEFFDELKSEESDRDLNEVKENLLSRSKRWHWGNYGYGCYWGGYSYCGCYNYYYYYCTSWYVWRKQNGEDVEIPVRPSAEDDVKTPPKAPSRKRGYRSYSRGHMTPSRGYQTAYRPTQPELSYPEQQSQYIPAYMPQTESLLELQADPQQKLGYGGYGGYRAYGGYRGYNRSPGGYRLYYY